MAVIQVVTDSACDLSPAMAEEQGVQVVPLTIRFGDEEFVDRVELSPKEFWSRLTTSPVIPETAAPSPGAFQKVFLDAASTGADGVVCITLSSAVSATYQAAVTAAATVESSIPVRVIDSNTLTMGLGLLVLAASDAAQAGRPLDSIVSEIESLRSKTMVYGTIDTLEFLKRGGRIGGAAAMLGSLLSIKPVVVIRDGAVALESRQRTRARAGKYLIDKAVGAAPRERIALSHGAVDDISEVVERLEQVPCAHELVVTELGPVVGTHAGPGSLGLAYQTAG